jgi:uncharacterized membrane protein SpoIIM required for sporulation
LFAVVLAGAAGLRIGSAVVFPGARSRIGSSATEAGRIAAMLFVADLLEGIGR